MKLSEFPEAVLEHLLTFVTEECSFKAWWRVAVVCRSFYRAAILCRRSLKNSPYKASSLGPESVIKAISISPRLRIIRISSLDLSLASDSLLKAIAESCSSLRELSLCCGTQTLPWPSLPPPPATGRISAEAIEMLWGSCPQLRFQLIQSVPALTDAGMTALARNAASLQELSLRDVPFISDRAVEHIAKNCPRIEVLAIEEAPVINETMLSTFSYQVPELRVLRLQGSVGLPQDFEGKKYPIRVFEIEKTNCSSDGAAALLNSCPDLKILRCSRCSDVSDEGIKAIAERCSKLEELSIQCY